MRILSILLLAMVFVQAIYSAQVYFAMKDYSSPNEFIFLLQDGEKIEYARNLISGNIKLRTHVMGTIVREKASYNPNWNFYMDPKTIGFFEKGLPKCDYTSSDLQSKISNTTILTRNFWCPSNSKILRELV